MKAIPVTTAAATSSTETTVTACRPIVFALGILRAQLGDDARAEHGGDQDPGDRRDVDDVEERGPVDVDLREQHQTPTVAGSTKTLSASTTLSGVTDDDLFARHRQKHPMARMMVTAIGPTAPSPNNCVTA